MSTWEALQEKAANLNLFLQDWQNMEKQLEQEPDWQARHTLNEPRRTELRDSATLLSEGRDTVAELKGAIDVLNDAIRATRQELNRNQTVSAPTQELINRMDSAAEQTLHTAQGLRGNFIAVLNIIRADSQRPPVDDDLNPLS
ncbi:hypothetical protein [Deinococcus sp. QL22]|uniref:hypothetical protein n=1 Tax=Deinococcus sp. QL22 TaxID=2939437 RepID=UPI002016E9DC|nr:hypothetical protein [Deinococcus sp. QL22]UQN06305.1 hypothetical protein M1R55_15820 [Deinococcus sp. QL22]